MRPARAREAVLTTANPNRLRVLFVDDEAAIREVMKIELPRMGHDVIICEDGQAALKVMDEHTFDAAIVDLRMPGLSGWDVIDHIKKVSPETEVVISTGHGDMDAAIQAVRRGAYDFLPKPCKLYEIAAVLKRIGEKRTLTNKTIALETRLKAVEGSPDLIGRTPQMLQVKLLVDKIAPTDSSVLILGETGTGKELVAKRVHDLSRRARMPFVAVNCAAIPEGLIESELFGYREGAFTGSRRGGMVGRLMQAHGGTLFLDEIGDMPLALQARLLRVLQERRVAPLGAGDEQDIDVALICATHRDLKRLVQEQHFREDLFYRVNGVSLRLPALRERDDLAAIIQGLLDKADARGVTLDPALTALLEGFDWPGNIRQLEMVVRTALAMREDGEQVLTLDHLTDCLLDELASSTAPSGSLKDNELEQIRGALARHQGNVSAAAETLGISRATLYRKLKQLRG